MTRAQTLRTPDRVARSAIARSGVQHKNRRAAAQYLFMENWIPDLRGGFAAACPGHEAGHRHLWRKRHLCAHAHGVTGQRLSGYFAAAKRGHSSICTWATR